MRRETKSPTALVHERTPHHRVRARAQHPHPGDFWQRCPPTERRAPAPVPEGHRRELAGGKTAPAVAAPGGRAGKSVPRRGIAESFPNHAGPAHRSRHTDVQPEFFDAPPGQRTTSGADPGAALAAAILPPANLRWCPSGTSKAPSPHRSEAAPGARLCRRPAAAARLANVLRLVLRTQPRSGASADSRERTDQIGRHRFPPFAPSLSAATTLH